MNKTIDLHTHSTASDGSMTPKELVRHAKANGLSAIAITDHDTVDGVEEALNEGKLEDIEVICGVEIGVDFKPEMHILGYFFGETYKNIGDTLQKLRNNREERNPKIVNKLKALGFDVSMEEVIEEAGGNVVGRPHVAKILIKKGYVKNMEEAFDKYLGSGKPAYFKKDKLTPEEGIQEILKAGGIPVLAHPKFLYLSNSELDKLLASLVQVGLTGMEIFYTEHTVEEVGNLLRLAIKHNLLVTGGSDFHGDFKPDTNIGRGHGSLNVPYELLDKMKMRI